MALDLFVSKHILIGEHPNATTQQIVKVCQKLCKVKNRGNIDDRSLVLWPERLKKWYYHWKFELTQCLPNKKRTKHENMLDMKKKKGEVEE